MRNLLPDASPVLIHELPDPLDELFPPEVVPGQTFFGQLLFHHPLPGNAGVIGARRPEGRVAEHAVPADHDVFDRHEQGMADVQVAGDIRGRHDDHERLPVRSFPGHEVAGVIPAVVDASLDQTWVIGFSEPRDGSVFGKVAVDSVILIRPLTASRHHSGCRYVAFFRWCPWIRQGRW